ncbi:hypothetical protein HK097_007673 [Rhizophlyctis rosea]|uniref:UspA domain-containing protein n=1 Tax=Rhizophlyctis rosea TaxID=64517 RepID=A0AAD5SCT7_9FUNG|nr:hypothetical protein HK097_007673 [Rhizophlyctis rosea]
MSTTAAIPAPATPSTTYKVMVAANNTPSSYKALQTAVDLCLRLKCEYKVYIVYFVALNPGRVLPYLDHLEKAYNMEIQSNAEKDVAECKEYFSKNYAGRVNYEFVEVEGEGETGPLIEEYVNETHPDLNLLVLGTRELGTLKRWALGSVSDYCMHHLKCPIVVVKDHDHPDE